MKQSRDILLRVCLAAYLYLIVKLILFKGGAINNETYMKQRFEFSWHHPLSIVVRMKQGNVIPFHEIMRTLAATTSHGLVNLIGNIAIFMPFGVLLGMLGSHRRPSVLTATAISGTLSLLLELSQAVLSIGSFDVDDIILNTFGGLMGVLLYWIYIKVIGLSGQQRTEQLTPPEQIC